MRSVVLQHFNLQPHDLIGKGSESRVYGLDAERVLRVYNGDPSDYIQRRSEFFVRLQAQNPPFDTPLLLETDVIEGTSYTVEKRMKGRDFGQALPELEGYEREAALTSYLDVAQRIGSIRFPDRAYGEILIDSPLQSDSWINYLLARMQKALEYSRADVELDVPEFEVALDDLEAMIATLDPYPPKCLVHGDYFPSNVFMDDAFNICGVGDFSYATVIGDARMDWAGAIVFLEALPHHRPEDTALLMQQLIARHGDEIEMIIYLYRLYYSVYYSGCKADDPKTYAWCIGNLHSHLENSWAI